MCSHCEFEETATHSTVYEADLLYFFCSIDFFYHPSCLLSQVQIQTRQTTGAGHQDPVFVAVSMGNVEGRDIAVVLALDAETENSTQKEPT